MLVKVATMFADIWASVPVMIWFDGNAMAALLCVPAWYCMVCKVVCAEPESGAPEANTGPKPMAYSRKGFLGVL